MLHLNYLFFSLGTKGSPWINKITPRRLQPLTKENQNLRKILVCPLLLLTYTFTPKTRKTYHSFWSPKPTRWFCWLLLSAEEQAHPQQSILLASHPHPAKAPLQLQWGGWRWVGRSRPLGITEGTDPCTDVWTAPQEASGQNSLDWAQDPWALGPALLTPVDFLGKNATERLPVFKCRREIVSTKADKSMLTGTCSARTQGKHFCSHRRAEIKSKLYQTDNESSRKLHRVYQCYS